MRFWSRSPLGSLVLVLSSHGSLYVDIVDAARALVPILACVALALAVRAPRTPEPTRWQPAVLLVFVTVFFSLIQFPFAAVVYFCYVAPLVFSRPLGLPRTSIVACRPELAGHCWYSPCASRYGG